MCKVLNKHHSGVPAAAVYIGRGSKWGNPFRIGDSAAVIARYERWRSNTNSCVRSMSSRVVISFASARRACHGDLLLRLANASRDERIAWWRAMMACKQE